MEWETRSYIDEHCWPAQLNFSIFISQLNFSSPILSTTVCQTSTEMCKMKFPSYILLHKWSFQRCPCFSKNAETCSGNRTVFIENCQKLNFCVCNSARLAQHALMDSSTPVKRVVASGKKRMNYQLLEESNTSNFFSLEKSLCRLEQKNWKVKNEQNFRQKICRRIQTQNLS